VVSFSVVQFRALIGLVARFPVLQAFDFNLISKVLKSASFPRHLLAAVPSFNLNFDSVRRLPGRIRNRYLSPLGLRFFASCRLPLDFTRPQIEFLHLLGVAVGAVIAARPPADPDGLLFFLCRRAGIVEEVLDPSRDWSRHGMEQSCPSAGDEKQPAANLISGIPLFSWYWNWNCSSQTAVLPQNSCFSSK
jgi:hypothetical protein